MSINVMKRYEMKYLLNAEQTAFLREKLKGQPWFCLTHASMLLRVAKEELKDGPYAALYEAVTGRMREALTQLRQDVTAFTVSFLVSSPLPRTLSPSSS